MSDPFHEPKEGVATIKREFTAVSSLNAPTAFTATVACEGAVSILYKEATGKEFPYQNYPRHKPGQWVSSLGIKDYYSPETQKFLDKIDGYSLDKARYEGTPAFRQHTSEKSRARSQEIVKGTERFVEETESLLTNEEAVRRLKSKTAVGK